VHGRLAILVAVAALAGCGSAGPSATHGRVSGDAGPTTAKVDRCVDRLVSRSTSGQSPAVRRYVRVTYCAPFARKGWIYDDGALRIAAQKWLENGMRCARASEGEPPHTVPCQEESGGEIECALLHVTRKTEVVAYIARLRRSHAVHCDDGTPLADLGVP
jgi:hypothetical protein